MKSGFKVSIYNLRRRFRGYFHYLRFKRSYRHKLGQASHVFFLPYYQTGGAEKVHLEIIRSISDQDIFIFFVHHSATDNFKVEFESLGPIFELDPILTGKSGSLRDRIKKDVIKVLNSSARVVFGSNNHFYYEVLKGLSPNIRTVDLVHAISGNNPILEKHYIDTQSIISHRIAINNTTKTDLLNLLQSSGHSVSTEITVIGNGVNIPETCPAKTDQINFGFIGRWSEEKRPEIYLRMAEKLLAHNSELNFGMAGIGMRSHENEINEAGATFDGEITDEQEMQDYYASLSFVVITSSREGFPMVIMEAMAQGAIPITTDVGGISEHISNGTNGVLIENSNEDQIVNDMVKAAITLIEDEGSRKEMSQVCFEYAKKHFNLDVFRVAYQDILLN